MTNQTKEHTAEIIPFPQVIHARIKCTDCELGGVILTYKRYVHHIMYNPPMFFCNACRIKRPNQINVDFSIDRTLEGFPFIPTGILEWNQATS